MLQGNEVKKIINDLTTAQNHIKNKKIRKAERILLRIINKLEKEDLSSEEKKYLFEAYKILSDEIYIQQLKKWDKAQYYLYRYLSKDKNLNFPARYYYLFALTQQRTSNYDLFYKNLKRAYKIAAKQNDYGTQIFSLNELGNYYFFINNPRMNIRLKRLAYALLEKSKSKIKNDEYSYKKRILLHDTALAYYSAGNFDKTFYYLDLYILENKQKDIYEKILAYLNALMIASNSGYLKKADQYKKNVVRLIKKHQDSFQDYSLYFNALAKYYETKRQWKKASEYFDKYIQKRKEEVEEQNRKNILEIQAKFEVDKKKQEKKIFQLENKKLKTINTSKDKFFSIIAHDLRSPFATIYSFISLMKKNQKYLTPQKIKELINELEKVVKNTYSLLENLLEWSRLQTGVLTYSPTKFDLCMVIAEIISIFQQNADQKSITLTFECKDKLHIFADKFMIGTIIRNLVNNAIKFTNNNGKIEVKATKENNKTIVSVSDNGIGMTKEETEKLFKLETSFSKLGTANEKGTGLGLILCNEFAKKNNANLTVESKKGKGTTFYLTINPTKKGKNEKK